MTLPTISGEFRVVADPELRFTPSGMAICEIRLVADSKKKVNDEWVDDKVLWINGSGFKQQAENMAESFFKGHLVYVVGKIYTDSWEDKDGNKRSTVKMNIDHIGHSTKWDASTSVKVERKVGSAANSSDPSPWGPSDDKQDEAPPF